MTHLIMGEVDMIRQYVEANSIVLDVGAFEGGWSCEVFKNCRCNRSHAFEPVPSTFAMLNKNMEAWIKDGSLIANNCAISNFTGLSEFWVYEDYPAMSTTHKRDPEEMARVKVSKPIQIKVPTITLDNYCSSRQIPYIGFLKIDTEGNEWAVLDGARKLLEGGKINVIQFEYGKCYLDAKTTLEMMFKILLPCGYRIAKVDMDGMEFFSEFHPRFETYEYCNYIAVK
jgi:FkbM family methyltransferase